MPPQAPPLLPLLTGLHQAVRPKQDITSATEGTCRENLIRIIYDRGVVVCHFSYIFHTPLAQHPVGLLLLCLALLGALRSCRVRKDTERNRSCEQGIRLRFSHFEILKRPSISNRGIRDRL